MRQTLLALVTLAITACGGAASTQASTSVAGVYALTSVNGSLPYTVPGTTSSFVGSTLTLSTSGTWREQGTARTVTNGQVVTQSYDDQGTWSTSSSSITLNGTSAGAPTYTGTVSGNTLLLSDGTFSFVFSK